MKKILVMLFLLAALIIAGAAGLYITDTYRAKSYVNKIAGNIPYISDTLGLDINYRVSLLHQKEYEDKKDEYEEEVNYTKKETILSHEDRYLSAIIFNPGEEKKEMEDKKDNSDTKNKTEEKYNYPSPANDEYSPEDLSKLAEIYSSMEPDQAIKILENFEDQVIIDIFSQMKVKKVAEIMAAFEPKRAGIISLKMLDNGQESK